MFKSDELSFYFFGEVVNSAIRTRLERQYELKRECDEIKRKIVAHEKRTLTFMQTHSDSGNVRMTRNQEKMVRTQPQQPRPSAWSSAGKTDVNLIRQVNLIY